MREGVESEEEKRRAYRRKAVHQKHHKGKVQTGVREIMEQNERERTICHSSKLVLVHCVI